MFFFKDKIILAFFLLFVLFIKNHKCLRTKNSRVKNDIITHVKCHYISSPDKLIVDSNGEHVLTYAHRGSVTSVSMHLYMSLTQEKKDNVSYYTNTQHSN